MTEQAIYEPRKKRYTFNRYIGIDSGDEEMYFTDIKFDCDWYWGGVYVEGLRPATEEELKEQAGNVEPEDYFSKEVTDCKYFDRDAFYEDMEDDWYERADVVREEDRDGETTYLCSGTHTHADSELMDKTYDELVEEYEEVEISRKDYNILIVLLQRFYQLNKVVHKVHQTDNNAYIETMNLMEDHLDLMERWNNKEKITKKEMKDLKEEIILNNV